MVIRVRRLLVTVCGGRAGADRRDSDGGTGAPGSAEAGATGRRGHHRGRADRAAATAGRHPARVRAGGARPGQLARPHRVPHRAGAGEPRSEVHGGGALRQRGEADLRPLPAGQGRAAGLPAGEAARPAQDQRRRGSWAGSPCPRRCVPPGCRWSGSSTRSAAESAAASGSSRRTPSTRARTSAPPSANSSGCCCQRRRDAGDHLRVGRDRAADPPPYPLTADLPGRQHQRCGGRSWRCGRRLGRTGPCRCAPGPAGQVAAAATGGGVVGPAACGGGPGSTPPPGTAVSASRCRGSDTSSSAHSGAQQTWSIGTGSATSRRCRPDGPRLVVVARPAGLALGAAVIGLPVRHPGLSSRSPRAPGGSPGGSATVLAGTDGAYSRTPGSPPPSDRGDRHRGAGRGRQAGVADLRKTCQAGPVSEPGGTELAATLRRIERAAGALATASVARMDETLPWFRELPADQRAWVMLVAQAGVRSLVEWLRAGGGTADSTAGGLRRGLRRRPAGAGPVDQPRSRPCS